MPKYIVQKTSITPEQILQDLLAYTKQNGECKEWLGAYATDGYPIQFGNKKVHRRVAAIIFGDIAGMVVRHTCDNPKCINPEHLVIGTQEQNIQDRVSRGRTYKVVTKELVQRVTKLLESKLLKQQEIADVVGLDVRRVSDIKRGLYDQDGKFHRNGYER